jgi:hypothetical protein
MALNIAYAIVGTAAICTTMVMDNELLVLFCFVLFVGFAYQYGSTVIDDSIKAETNKMSKEFDAFFEIQKKVLQTLITYHFLQISIIEQMKSLLEFSKGEISKILSAKKALLDASLVIQAEQKLSLLASKEQAIAQSVQLEASTFVTSKIYEVFTTENKAQKSLKEKILVENMKKLESLGSK